ncbi:MAG TPA: XRE family transcriptional regulator [Sphingomicrobium sp.]
MSTILRSQETGTPVLSDVAGNLRRLRAERQLSQSALADLANLSRRMVSAIENGEANPSLSTLDRLAEALGCALTTLIRPADADEKSIRTIAWRGQHAMSQAILLGSAPASREAELWHWALGEGERYPSEANSQNWHEMIFVFEGTLQIEAADATHVLESGDFLIFSSARPYIFANTSAGTTRFVRNVVL